MPTDLDPLIETYRKADSGSDAWRTARNQLALAVHSLAIAYLKKSRWNHFDQAGEDVANEVAARLPDYLAGIDHPNPVAAVFLAAKRAAIDFHNGLTDNVAGVVILPIDWKGAPREDDRSAGPILVDKMSNSAFREEDETRTERADQITRLKAALERLAQADRDLFQQRFVEGTEIEELARQELDRHPVDRRSGNPRTQLQARNAVDQRLTRIKKRLRDLIEEGES